MRILLVAPHRVGNTAVLRALTANNIVPITDLSDETKRFSDHNEYTDEAFLNLVQENSSSSSIIRIHPEWIPIQYRKSNRNNEGLIYGFQRLVDMYAPTHVFTVLRKNLHDQATSFTNVNIRIENENAPDHPDPWHTKYTQRVNKPRTWELTQSLYESFICSELADRLNFPIFWYEEIYTGDRTDLFPLLDYLNLKRDLAFDTEFFKYFSQANKLKQ